jgi:hypothetical protein
VEVNRTEPSLSISFPCLNSPVKLEVYAFSSILGGSRLRIVEKRENGFDRKPEPVNPIREPSDQPANLIERQSGTNAIKLFYFRNLRIFVIS